MVINMAGMTPMMTQYMETKKQYKDCILFYRLGDFYEMFFEDAKLVSKELELTLTGKDCGLEERAPMCGVPYHALDNYLTRLVSKGYKVAICEQVEDPKMAKGLVKREVTRIVTPGTNLNMQALEESKNNYIMCISHFPNKIGIAIADVTTGDFYITEVEGLAKLTDELYKYMPTEIICNDAFLMSGFDIDDLKNRLKMAVYSLEPWYFDEDGCRKCLMEHFKVNTLAGMGIEDFPSGMISAGALMQYLLETQKTPLTHITHITPYLASRFMLLDSSTRRNLELTETLREKQKRGSLLWVLDKTKTAMGARQIRTDMEQPLIDKDDINDRLDTVEQLCKNMVARDEIREYLNPIYDMERLLGKVSYKTANPRDLISFANSMEMLPHIKTVLKEFDAKLLREIDAQIDSLEDLFSLIKRSICEEPPLLIREGGIIRDGFDRILTICARQRRTGKTGLRSLRRKTASGRELKTLKSNITKYSAIILRLPIRLRTWFLTIMCASRRLSMPSAIQRRS